MYLHCKITWILFYNKVRKILHRYDLKIKLCYQKNKDTYLKITPQENRINSDRTINYYLNYLQYKICFSKRKIYMNIIILIRDSVKLMIETSHH